MHQNKAVWTGNSSSCFFLNSIHYALDFRNRRRSTCLPRCRAGITLSGATLPIKHDPNAPTKTNSDSNAPGPSPTDSYHLQPGSILALTSASPTSCHCVGCPALSPHTSAFSQRSTAQLNQSPITNHSTTYPNQQTESGKPVSSSISRYTAPKVTFPKA